MVDRRFTEVELREILERAEGYRSDIVEGRFVIATRHRRRWEVIIEPDALVKRLSLHEVTPQQWG